MEIVRNAVKKGKKERRGEYEHNVAYSKHLLALAKELEDEELDEVECSTVAKSCYEAGDIKGSIEYGAKSLRIAKETGDWILEGEALADLAWFFYIVGYHKQSLCNQSLRIAKEVGDKVLEAIAFNVLSRLCCRVGVYKQSIEFGSRSLNIAKEVGDRTQEARAHDALACSYYELRNFEQGEKHSQQSLIIAKEIEDNERKAKARSSSGKDVTNIFR